MPRAARAARAVRPLVKPGGGSQWTPAREPTTLCWFRADQGVVLSGGNVATWTDTVGGVILTASDTAATMSTFDGKPSVHTAGGKLLASPLSLPKPWTLYWIGSAMTPAEGTYAVLVSTSADPGTAYATLFGANTEVGAIGVTSSSVPGELNAPSLFAAQFLAESVQQFRNNLTVPIGSVAVATPDPTQFTLGCHFDGSFPLTGDHAELWIVLGVPDAALLARYVAYVKRRYPSVPAAS